MKNVQKQSPDVFCKKFAKFLEIRKICKKTLALESLYASNSNTGISYEFRKIFKNNYLRTG